MKLNYIYKNIYFMNSYLDFEDKIPIFMNSRTVTFKMYSGFEHFIDPNKFSFSIDRSDLKVNVSYDKSIFNDGYDLEITKTAINIRANNIRGITYAFKVLDDLVISKNNKFRLPIIKINDEPSFAYRGIIEGYYGEPWSYAARSTLADFMNEHRLNTYMYAPKSDPYHRVKWNELYPQKELSDLISFKNSLESKNIDFYYCISPGYTKEGKVFQYTKEEDFELLFKKLDQVIDQGITKYGLLLDDIDYKLTGENKNKFRRPGIAHAYICNLVYEYLSKKVVDLSLVMCPTEYHQIGESEYRNDLKTLLNKDIKVFWTGDNVCAEVITDEQARLTKEAFGNDLFIWDNFPVSDFTYGVRQYMGPIINRTVDLNKYATGYIINPMNLYEASKISMITQAHYAWNSPKYDSSKSFEFALKSLGEDFYEKGRAYINYNLPSVLSHYNLDIEKEMINENEESIIYYIEKVALSAEELLGMDLPIIIELKPWLERTIIEEKIIKKIINKTIKKEELIKFLEIDKFSGSELLDNLIIKYDLLNTEEFSNLIKKRRGTKWYRVWEEQK